MNESKEIILRFLHTHTLGVVSTMSPEGKPQSAVVEFGETPHLEIIFDTFDTYRKYHNLKQNPAVSFVIGWNNEKTLQYEGTARELSGNEATTYQEIYFAKNPKARKFAENAIVRYFLVTPAWIRYADLLVNPWQVEEISF